MALVAAPSGAARAKATVDLASAVSLLFVPCWVHSLLDWLSQRWGDVVPAWLAVLVAAFFGVQSWRSSRRAEAAKAAAQAAESKATEAAEEAAVAAERSADAAERLATAQEAQVVLLQDAAEAEERKPWRIHRVGNAMDFRLTNRTNIPKYAVVVTGEPTGVPSDVFIPGGGGDNSFDVVDGQETVELDLYIMAQTVDRSVTVNWHPTPDHDGDAWTQRVGLR